MYIPCIYIYPVRILSQQLDMVCVGYNRLFKGSVNKIEGQTVATLYHDIMYICIGKTEGYILTTIHVRM